MDKVYFAVFDKDSYSVGSGSTTLRTIADNDACHYLRYADINMFGLGAEMVDISDEPFGVVRSGENDSDSLFALGRTMNEAVDAISKYINSVIRRHRTIVFHCEKALDELNDAVKHSA